FRPLDEARLRGPCDLLRGVELGEEGATVALDRAAGVTEPLPELVGDRLRKTGARLLVLLPGFEERVELGRRLLPLDRFGVACGERLDLLDERGAVRDGRLDRLAGLLCLRLARLCELP